MAAPLRRARRIPHSFWTRAAYSLSSIVFVVAVGTIGMHYIEGTSYLDSFYFTALIATGEGPNYTPATAGGKVFAAVLSFFSVGTVITALLFLFGPFFGSVIRLGWEKVEAEAEKEKQKLENRS